MFRAMKWTFIGVLLCSMLCSAEECIPGKTKVQITNVEFERTPGLTLALRNQIREQLEAKVHDYCQLANDMSKRALDILQQHGYFKARVQDPTWKQTGGTDAEQQIRVLFVIEPGSTYTLDSIGFNGSTVFDQQELRSLVPMRDEEMFNVFKIREGLKNLRELYCSHGYVNFTPVPNTEIDDEKHVIKLLFDLDEGEQYRVGKLDFEGLEPYPGAARQLAEAWQPYIGRLYDCRLWNEFSAQLTLQQIPALAAAVKNVEPGIRTNSQSRTVEFIIRFLDPR